MITTLSVGNTVATSSELLSCRPVYGGSPTGLLTPWHDNPLAVRVEDEVLYFLLVDRFSDDAEDEVRDLDGNLVHGTTPPLTDADRNSVDRGIWAQAGVTWVGGTLKGVTSKLGYLKRLGVTALWISPVLKQTATPPGASTNYHGYATQNFLDVDPHFGTADDLRDLVQQAHQAELRIILDIVLNHAGEVFAYDLSDRSRYPPPTLLTRPAPCGPTGTAAPIRSRAGGTHRLADPVHRGRRRLGLAGRRGVPRRPARPGNVDPAGHIKNWDYPPEYREGDFQDLKDVTHGTGDVGSYQAAPRLKRWPWHIAGGSRSPTSTASASTPSNTWTKAPPDTSPRSCTSSPSQSARNDSCWSARTPAAAGLRSTQWN